MFKSVAKWPHPQVNLGNSENTSDYSHATLSSARIICQILENDGFGGDGVIFPIETWVEDEDGNKLGAYESSLEYAERKSRESESAKFIRAMSLFSSLGWDMPNFGFKNPSGADIRNDPEREKTNSDLERLAAAQAKRERKGRK